ncbi:MAG: RodZ domain-containing protein [Gammaproteobacteria bacterium]
MNTEVDQNRKTPGHRLKDARELKELNTSVIAQRLRLSEHQVEAIENDNYEQFPAIAYVRGYIRSYATLVDLNADELVEQLDTNVRSVPVLEPFVSQPDQQMGSGDKHIKAVTYSLIATLLLLLGLWWHSNRSVPELSSVESTSGLADQNVIPLQAPVISDEAIQTDVGINDQATTQISMGSDDNSFVETEQEEPRVLEHDFAVVQLSEMPEPPDQNPPVEFSSEPVQSVIVETVSTEQVRSPSVNFTEGSEITTDEFDDQRIILQFIDESWVEITDNTNTVRFSRIGRPDEVVSLTGGAPFSVVIGKASVVIMNYQGSIIDLDSLARGQVARFTLDENGAYR